MGVMVRNIWTVFEMHMRVNIEAKSFKWTTKNIKLKLSFYVRFLVKAILFLVSVWSPTAGLWTSYSNKMFWQVAILKELRIDSMSKNRHVNDSFQACKWQAKLKLGKPGNNILMSVIIYLSDFKQNWKKKKKHSLYGSYAISKKTHESVL